MYYKKDPYEVIPEGLALSGFVLTNKLSGHSMVFMAYSWMEIYVRVLNVYGEAFQSMIDINLIGENHGNI